MSVSYPIYCSDEGTLGTAEGDIYYSVADTDVTSNAASITAGSITYQTAGTLSSLQVVIVGNVASSGSIAVHSSIGGSDGNQHLLIGSSSNGTFTDLSDSDNISAGTTVCAHVNSSLNVGCTLGAVNFLFSATSGTTRRVACSNTAVTYTTANNTSYWTLMGQTGKVGTESNAETLLFVTGTLHNASIVVTGNAHTLSHCYSRVGTGSGQSTGNIAIAITASTNGTFSDLSGTDTLANTGTYVDWMVVTGSGSGSITINSISADITTSDQTSIAGSGYVGKTASTGTTLRYLPFAGGCESLFTTESSTQLEALAAYVVSQVSINVVTNTTPITSTLNFRKNAANGNSSVSVTSTGVFTDTSDSDTVAATDLIDYSLQNSTSGTIDFVTVSAKLAQPSTGFQPDEDFAILAYTPPDYSVISVWQ